MVLSSPYKFWSGYLATGSNADGTTLKGGTLGPVYAFRVLRPLFPPNPPAITNPGAYPVYAEIIDPNEAAGSSQNIVAVMDSGWVQLDGPYLIRLNLGPLASQVTTYTFNVQGVVVPGLISTPGPDGAVLTQVRGPLGNSALISLVDANLDGSGFPVIVGGVDVVSGKVQRVDMLTVQGVVGSAFRVARRGRVLFDSGVIAGGALIDSGVLDLTGIEQLYFFADNSAGGVGRNLNWKDFLDDGVSLVDTTLLFALAAAGFGRVAFGPGAAAVGPISMGDPRTPPTKGSVQLVAGGAGNGRVVVWGR